MRFLTKVTGGNAVAGVGGSVAALENKLKTSASTAAEDAKKSLIRLYQANPTLKK
jgi:hypothetical protein